MINTLEYEQTNDEVYLCVENDSGMVYEAKLHEDYVVVRPATPTLYRNIRKIDYNEFTRDFTDFCGDRDSVFYHQESGMSLPFQQERKH